MAIAVSLEPATGPVTLGVPLQLTLTVRNDSTIVQGYHLTPVGPAAAHISVAPDQLSVFPGSTESAVVTVLLPRTPDFRAGELPIGVRVVSTTLAPIPPVEGSGDLAEFEDEGPLPDSETAEAVLIIEMYVAVAADLSPKVSRSRGRKRVRLAVDNNGNSPMSASIFAGGAEGLRFAIRNPEVFIEPGRAQFVPVTLIPRRRILRGAAASHPYALTVSPATGDPIVVDGTHLQEPVFPSWFWKALLALAALIALLILLWNLLLKPTVQDAAREAVAGPLAQVAEQAEAAQEAADAAQQSADTAQETADGANSNTTPPVPPQSIVTAKTFPLTITASAGQSVPRDLPESIPEGSVMRITDLVLNNPQGDSGTVRLSYGNNTTLLLFTTENYRDLDLHFVTPIEVPGNTTVSVTLSCVTVGVPPGRTPTGTCLSNLLITGSLVTPPPEG